MTNGWTTYGKQQMLQIALAGASAPTLEVSLYEGSADPGGSPVELSTPGYGRASIDLQTLTDDSVTNSYDVVIGPMSATDFVGVAVGDPTGIWFWDDDGGTISVPDGQAVTFPAGTITVTRTS